MTTKPMDTCSSFRGTSCLCINSRHCLWMGIRPSGLGLRLKSRQLQPGGAADGGSRCPFAATVLPPASVSGGGAFFAFRGASPLMRRIWMGLRDRVRLRRSSSSLSNAVVVGVALLLHRLRGGQPPPGGRSRRGPKVRSVRRAAVGLLRLRRRRAGEMTRGVAGMPLRRGML